MEENKSCCGGGCSCSSDDESGPICPNCGCNPCICFEPAEESLDE